MKCTSQLVLALIGMIPVALSEAILEAAQAGNKRANLETRQSSDWCGYDILGDSIYCSNGYVCCQGSVVWECIAASAECCTMGTFCDAGYSCMVTGDGVHYCEGSGGATVGVASGTAAVAPAASTVPPTASRAVVNTPAAGANTATGGGGTTLVTASSTPSGAGNNRQSNALLFVPLALGLLAVM